MNHEEIVRRGLLEKDPPMVYIAGRFSADTRAGVEENIARAEALGVEVSRLGGYPVCPHANTAHPEYENTQPYGFWIRGTLRQLRTCEALACVEGWEQSTGARGEVKEAEHVLHIPVFRWGTGQLIELRDWIARWYMRTDPNAVTIPPPRNEAVTLPDVRSLMSAVSADETFGTMGDWNPEEG